VFRRSMRSQVVVLALLLAASRTIFLNILLAVLTSFNLCSSPGSEADPSRFPGGDLHYVSILLSFWTSCSALLNFLLHHKIFLSSSWSA